MPIICKYDNCKISASFGYDKALYCKKHKEDGMYNIYKNYCKYKTCRKYASYAFIGEIASYCSIHKEDNMIDVYVKRCQFNGCNKSAYFDLLNGKGKYCSLHKEINMIDIKHKKCIIDNCSKHPLYNFKDKKALYCFNHKLDNMIFIKKTKCSFTNCNNTPSFGYLNNPLQFCSQHRDINMIDNKHTKCIICDSFASYGKPGIKISHCAKHREKGMIKRSTAKCKDCLNPAVYGINFIPLHCEIHKTAFEQNYIEFPCISCGLLSILDINNICEYCNPDNFIKARLIKQNNLMSYLDKFNLKGNSTDLVIDSGICGKERPDRVYDLGSKIVILECDEHQHRDRNIECENIRMINICQSYGGIPVYFIRWNPDDYICTNNNDIPETIDNRYIEVKNLIENIINDIIKLPLALLSVLYMYYDGWTSIDNQSYNILLNFKE